MRNDPMDRQPIFIHVHVPKTAGQSLNVVLQQWFKGTHYGWYQPNPGKSYTEEELSQFVAERPKLLSLASHSIRVFPPLIGGRPALYYTFLRHPIDRMVSNITYAKKNIRNFSEQHRKQWPADIEKLDVREILRRRHDQSSGPLHGNGLNRFFTESAYFRKQSFLQRANGADVNEHYSSVCVGMSTTVLDSFALVGLTEEFDKSIEMLRRLFCSFGITAPTIELPRNNISSELRDDLSWINERDEVGRKVLQAVEQDMVLYDYGKSLFAKHCEKWLSNVEPGRTERPVNAPAVENARKE
jgi:hypothetical protein